jgi:16S rRNA processing protein RimM
MTLHSKQDFFTIGSIIKPHGLKGDVLVEVDEGFGEAIETSDYLLVEVDGGLVPFFISENGVNFRTDTTFCVSFDDLETAEKVKPYCGCKIYLHKDVIREESDDVVYNELIGFNVFDSERGELGKIIQTDNFSGNIVLTIQHGASEILIPLSEDFIVLLDEKKNELHLECPEGLIDLYLE